MARFTKEEKFEFACARARGNPKGYMNSAITIQEQSFEKKFAEEKLHQSCFTLIEIGFCGGKDCDNCALQQTHNKTLELISNPDEVQRRYTAWVELQKERNAHSGFNDRKVHYSSKGRRCETWRAPTKK